MMTLTCKLCHEIITPRAIPPNEIPPGVNLNDPAIQWQVAMVPFMEHLQLRHPERVQVFSQMAHAYLTHLCAQVATSSFPDFERIREEQRAICYLTLHGDVEPVGFVGPPAAPGISKP